ncbi:MAG: hypothetical protein EA367_05955 [Leptolyngbya sp. DLM2.Bin15]|nr:MAG: hypothetical protein EA367_05955 [Leptolyngbya sp. DLM2.Bin15]
MALDSAVMQAVEKLEYRATVGDIASQAGINISTAERGLLALASEAGGHLQVSEAGEVAYQFPKNFRTVLRNKYWRLRVQELWDKIWGVLFYLIRISFGVLLIVSIVLIALTILAIVLAITFSNREGNNNNSRRSGSGGGLLFLPFRLLYFPDLFWVFSPGYSRQRHYRQAQLSQPGRSRSPKSDSEMNFLESVFSFLFGDGNPNADLEERRWQAIATVIRNNQGAVVAEQIAPYLDDVGKGYDREYESYMLPVLTRYNGSPQVSPEGHMVYHFPDLQVSAEKRGSKAVPAYLKELPWKFSSATQGQLTMAAGLGGLNFVLAIVLAALLQDQALVAELGGLVVLVNGLFPFLFAYGTAFLSIPLIRYLWLKGRNSKVEARNERRQQQAIALNQGGDELQQKMDYARQFAAQSIVSRDNLAYTTEQDLLDQEADNSAKLDAEWQKRLDQSGS